MRFSAAIHQIARRESGPEPTTEVPAEGRQVVPQQPAPSAVQEPPPDLDQRVRLSGEW